MKNKVVAMCLTGFVIFMLSLFLSTPHPFFKMVVGQDPQPPRGRFDGPRGPGGFGGPGGPGGPMSQERKLLEQFDVNKDGWLNDEERQKARAWLADNPSGQGMRGPGGPGGFGPPGGAGGPGGPGGPGRGRALPPSEPGDSVQPENVSPGSGPLYQHDTLRTLFLTFTNEDWEEELESFNNSDVDVPATLVVDGQSYQNVGVHFRGASSYFMVPRGYKRSLNLSLDLVDSKQRLLGYKTLNLLNCNGDPSFMRAVLYADIASKHIPIPKSNFVRVVINGEDWGLYVSSQQFNKEFIAEHFPTDKGARWKVPGSPNGRGGLEYIGDKIEDYKARFEIKSGDKDESWHKLIELCRILNETPIDELPQALSGKLDIDSTLWFLALDVGLVNSDGYWVRASDYNLYMDPNGKFFLIPHDVNETFSTGMGGGPGPGRGGPPGGGFGPGPGFDRGGPPGAEGPPPVGERPGGPPRRENVPGQEPGGPPPGGAGPGRMGPGGMGPQSGGVELDPLVGIENPRMPLRSRLLAVPAYREQYLRNLKTLAEEDLVWATLEPRIATYVELVEPIVVRDKKKVTSIDDFHRSIGLRSQGAREGDRNQSRPADRGPREMERRGMQLPMSLKDFIERRREFLLNHPAIKEL
jgi:spore coat protein CotH